MTAPKGFEFAAALGQQVATELLEPRPDGSRLCVDLKPIERVFQPRFAAYARVHGRTPEEQIAHDKTAWPGGVMCGFILWNGARWREWRAANGFRRDDDYMSPEDHARYDRWLAELPVVTS